MNRRLRDAWAVLTGRAEIDWSRLTEAQIRERIADWEPVEIVHSSTYELHGELSASVDDVFSVNGVPIGTTPTRF